MDVKNAVVKWWPTALLVTLLLASIPLDGGPELLALVFLLVLQGVWLGVPWAARKLGESVGKRTA